MRYVGEDRGAELAFRELPGVETRPIGSGAVVQASQFNIRRRKGVKVVPALAASTTLETQADKLLG
jgi:hypothetical protein